MFDSPNDYYTSLAYYDGQKIGSQNVIFNNQIVPIASTVSGPNSMLNIYKNTNLAQNMLQYQQGAAIGVVNQITRILNYLNQSKYAQNTIVVILNDHGLAKFPANNEISKNSLFEVVTRSPLMFKIPGIKGGINPNPTELVSVLPTLCDLTGIDCSDDAINVMPLDGTSLVPGIVNPSLATQSFAISQYERCEPIGDLQSNTCMNSLTSNGPNQKPNPFHSQMTYKITEMIDGTIYQYAVSFPFTRTYSYYGPTPANPEAPGMQLYNPGVEIWRTDFNNTGPVSTDQYIELFMYARTPEAAGKNLLFSITPANAKIRDQMLADLRSAVDPYTLQNRLKNRL
jgi:hypothetical protein